MQKKYQLSAIGAVIVVAVLLISWFLFSIHPNVGDGKNQIRVRFTDVDKITGGTRVTFAGRPVGEVIGIHLLPEARKMNADGEDVYAYEVTLKLDSKVALYPTDEISLKTSGLMGERTIAITPRRLDSEAKPLQFDDVMFAASSGSVDETMASVQHVTKKLETLIDGVGELETEATKMIDSMTSTSNEVGTFVKRINQLDLAGSCHALLDKASNGNGTVGRLLSSDDLYLKTYGLMNKANIVLDDVNNYGPLFHLNKTWQRDRVKKLEMVARLQKPAEFQQYLNQELQNIALAVSRCNRALDKANNELDEKAKDLLNDDFKELISSVDALNQSLKEFSEVYSADEQKPLSGE